ncbi:hypothetical protein Sipo8835_38010 [Streptomyces ipomoeae]|uniref:Uncharacterized protein n=2 Tax=Streptomyces ipomoeae TaxID=103232 RepID=L1KWV8_9ACTN|nr:hypothetical protein [Streptomyces ipomoeae]EKX65054.1 hypothetical protein STRIP9103_04402 [Streptomyces ipomoeae 91-03]MDX2696382.1 hypothetical protein [Streptomyces ipomoeae]MDX2825663.1 hypothetical protein [Streptomyces ipomoeae]MDX2841905.1 hypothetical protein [Streptomyces ipomoeae]MDX2878295.1 hypothetical protein [Streptomyces ipomoeae]
MRTLVAKLCEKLLPGRGRRRAAAAARPGRHGAPLEPGPPPPPPPVDDLWPFEPYDNFVRPYVLTAEELYVVYGMEGAPA